MKNGIFSAFLETRGYIGVPLIFWIRFTSGSKGKSAPRVPWFSEQSAQPFVEWKPIRTVKLKIRGIYLKLSTRFEIQ